MADRDPTVIENELVRLIRFLGRGRQRPRCTGLRAPMLRNLQGRDADRARNVADTQVSPRKPKAPNDPDGASVEPVSRHRDRPRPGIGREMLKLAREGRFAPCLAPAIGTENRE
jgi:hypothetical protein